jgi:archaellum component FlaG (FlaF/FlaG flagellin family)
MSKKILIFITLLIIFSIPAFAAADYYTFDEENKTATIYKNSQKWLVIKGEVLSMDIVEMREKITVTSNYNYVFSPIDDFGEDYEVHKGKSVPSQITTVWYSQVEENYTVIVDDTEPGWQNNSRKIYNNLTGFNKTIWDNRTIQVVIGNHTEARTRINESLFTPTNKKIQAGQTLTFIKVTKKKAEIGEFSILLKPKFMGISIKELTWWDGSWQYVINNPIANGARPYQISLNISNSTGTNNATHVYCGGFCNVNFTDIRFTLDNTTALPHWIEDNATGKVWVNVTANGTVNMYYGNPSAASVSSGANTFDFFDDFEDGDYNGWTKGSVATLSMPTDSTTYLKSTISTGATGVFYTAAYPTAMASSLSIVYEGRVKPYTKKPALRTCGVAYPDTVCKRISCGMMHGCYCCCEAITSFYICGGGGNIK